MSDILLVSICYVFMFPLVDLPHVLNTFTSQYNGIMIK
jgi:hypothetical protein